MRLCEFYRRIQANAPRPEPNVQRTLVFGVGLCVSGVMWRKVATPRLA